MIFVTVGTHHQGFDRLVQAADELAAASEETVVIQRGVTDVFPRHARHFDFCTMQEMEDWIFRARVVIAQAGAGTIITALQQAKPLVVSPRLKAYGENYTDHQIELAAELDHLGRAALVTDLSGVSLQAAAQRALTLHQRPDQSAALVDSLRQQMVSWQPLAGQISTRLDKLTRRLNKHQLLLPFLPFIALAAYLRAAFFAMQGKTKDDYAITTAYLPRKTYHQFDDTLNADLFQDEVYQAARRFMTEQKLPGILDVGCGSGHKLMKYFSEEETLGLEMPGSLVFLQKKYPQRKWALSDFNHSPQGEFGLTISVDVIEHLTHPDDLLEFLKRLNCNYFLLSTPERSRLGLMSRFRSRNRCHLREWDQPEFIEYLSRHFQIVETGVVGHHDQYVIAARRS
ncbi:MAG: hypothetical protein K8R77_07455 [Anaerolineaceae bacterium]|nr:hypothetical protein [Anaerolineaceae bacterium]